MKARIPKSTVSMLFTSRAWALCLGAWTLLDQSQSGGQGTFYSDRAAFMSALQSSTTANFESLAPSRISDTGTSRITDGGVTITSAGYRLFVASASGDLYPTPGDGQYVWNFDSGHPVGISGPAGMNAFGADFSGGIVPQNNPFHGTITVNLVGGQIYTYNFTGQVDSWAFQGFVFPNPISTVFFDDGGPSLPGFHEEMLDNVTFGVAVPEPQTWVLALVGFAYFGALRFRKRA